MEDKINKVLAIVGDLLNDSGNVTMLQRQLVIFGVKSLYFKDLNTNMQLTSIILVLNEKCEYATDADLFIHNAICERIPIIVIYTDINDYREIHDSVSFTDSTKRLWHKIPAFDEERYMIATVHIPLGDLKQIIKSHDFEKGTNLDPSDYYLLKKEVE